MKKKQTINSTQETMEEKNKARSKAADTEKGIEPKKVREAKKEELLKEGKAVKRPIFNRDVDENPVQLKDDE